MIALAKFHEARRLLAEGRLSQRKIALQVGISRATVSAIAQGHYADREARQRVREDYVPSGPLARCGGCGGLVQMPCLYCHVRRMEEQEQAIRRQQRRAAQRRKLARLLHLVREAGRQRDANDVGSALACYFPPAVDGRPLDCK
jgi:hypothetical protein